MSDSDGTRQEFLTLRDSANSAQLATLANDTTPEASYAPCVWFKGDCYLFLSELASHTRNLKRNPEISLLLLDVETATSNPFARRRINLYGSAQIVSRDSDLFDNVLTEFQRRFGKVMKIIEPLPDFHLFRVHARGGRFIRGFGQAYELEGAKLDQFTHVDPRQ